MELFIETLTGTGFELRVSPMETVMSVKTKIQRLEGIPVSQQHLIWRSEELADDCLLQDYKITDGATLRLVISMRGGPINTRRVPVEDPTWKEIVDYMESNREEIWEKLPYGRQVTLLVYRDGDQVNFFRVMDRGDGTVVPLSQALGTSTVRGVGSTAERVVEEAEQQRFRENNVTMQKMRSIRKQMDALTLHKKTQDGANGGQSAQPSAYGAPPVAKYQQISRPLRLPPVPGGSRMPFAPHHQFPHRVVNPANANSTPGGATPGLSSRRSPLVDVLPARPSRLATPRSGDPRRTSSGHGGQEVDGDADSTPVMRLSECRGQLPDLRTIPSLHGDGGLLRVETGCGPTGGGGGELESPRWSGGSGRSSGSSATTLRGNGAVALGMLSSGASDLSTRRRIRNPPAHPKSRGGSTSGVATATSAATSATNFDSLEQLQLQTLAKFDPRISVQTSPRPVSRVLPSSTSAASAASSSTAGANSGGDLAALVRRRDSLVRGVEAGGARPKSSREVTEELSRRQSATLDEDTLDQSLSFGSLRRSPPRGSMITAAAAKQQQQQQQQQGKQSRLVDGVSASFHWNKSGASSPGAADSERSSRESSAESGSLGQMNVITKDSSSSSLSSSTSLSQLSPPSSGESAGSAGVGSGASPMLGLVAVARLPLVQMAASAATGPTPARKSVARCLVCRRKTGLATSYSCRCGGNFCASHRYAELHGCSYDYKTEGRKIIAESNPLVTASKLPKI